MDLMRDYIAPKRYENASLEDFNERIKDKIGCYLREYGHLLGENDEEPDDLLIHGSGTCGKTHLCWAIIKEINKKKDDLPCYFKSSFFYIHPMRDHLFFNDENHTAFMRRFLIIEDLDDLFIGDNEKCFIALSRMLKIVGIRRYLGLPTIFSSRITIKQMRKLNLNLDLKIILLQIIEHPIRQLLIKKINNNQQLFEDLLDGNRTETE